MASVTTLWSRAADFSAVVNEFPGVFDSTASVTITDMYGENGTYSNTDTGATYTDIDAKIAIANTSGITTDQYVYVVWSGGAGGADGYFKVAAIDTNVSITLGDVLATGVAKATDDTVSYYIGGIGEGLSDGEPEALQDMLDFIGPACGARNGDATNNLDILLHAGAAVSHDATIDIDAISGSTDTRVRVLSKDSSFEGDGTELILNVDAELLASMLHFGQDLINVTFKDFTIDGVDLATNCILVDDSLAVTAPRIKLIDCLITRAVEDGISNDSGASGVNLVLMNTNVTDNGEAGVGELSAFDGGVSIYGGVISGNGGAAIESGGVGATFSNILITGNGSGINLGGQTDLKIISCTIADNLGDAIIIDGVGTSARDISVVNTVISGNIGADFAPTGSNYERLNVSNCCLFGNGSTYTPPVIGRMEKYSIITDNPDFGVGYVPNEGSPLIAPQIGVNWVEAGGGGGTFPDPENVLAPFVTNVTPGTLTLSDAEDTLTRAGDYGVGGDGTTPVYEPATEANYKLGETFGANGTEFTGELDPGSGGGAVNLFKGTFG